MASKRQIMQSLTAESKSPRGIHNSLLTGPVLFNKVPDILTSAIEITFMVNQQDFTHKFPL